MAFNGVNLSSSLLRNVRNTIGPVRDPAGLIELSRTGYTNLLRASSLRRGGHRTPVAEPDLRKAFASEIKDKSPETRRATMEELLDQFHKRGASGFVSRDGNDYFLPRLAGWHSAAAPRIWKTIGAFLLVLSLTWLCLDFGNGNQDLGRVEWTLEWLFTMPVSARGLFTAQLLGYAISEPFMWCGAWPVLVTIFVSAGWGWLSIVMGGAAAFYLSILIASVRVAGETWLRSAFAPPRLKNMQALFTVLGTIGLFFLIANVSDSTIATKFCSWAMQWPDAITWMPLMLPARAPSSTGGAAAGAAMVASLVIFGFAAVSFSSWLVRGGLLSVSGAYVGKRRSTKGSSAGQTTSRAGIIPRGIAGKDLRLLSRDRNFLVQTLVVPVMIIGFQLVIHGGIVQAVRTEFQQAAVLAFAVGGYVLIATALSVLSVEGNSLWMLYTFPQSIPQILLRKTRLWIAIALIYTLVVLIVCASVNHNLQPGDAIFAVMALAGVVIYAFIASGIGILATDPLETEVRRRIRPEMVQLYMILAAMYAHALYAPSAWTRLAQVVLSSLLAFALWQKVRDRAPFLLDPVAAATRSISLADGMIAALAFFVLQGLCGFAFAANGIPPGLTLFISFVIAGALVVAFAFYTFWRTKTPGVLFSVGLRRAAGDQSMSFAGALMLGLAGGVCAASFACAGSFHPCAA